MDTARSSPRAASIDAAYERLCAIARGLESAVVAFSAGVDSTLALKVCADVLGERCVAVVGRSASLAPEELEEARRFTHTHGIRLIEIETNELADPVYRTNGALRCLACKTELYGRARALADDLGFKAVVDGTNADDLRAPDRPGNAAAKRLEVRSVLAEAGLGKREVRAIARRLGLSAWDKPAMACLSSRIPFGTPITVRALEQVARAEGALRELGLQGVRVRHHGSIARLELPPEPMARLFASEALRDAVLQGVRAAGFEFVCLDLAGYRRAGLAAAAPRNGPSTPKAENAAS